MDPVTVLPRRPFHAMGAVSSAFHDRGITQFREAAAFTGNLPFGFNNDPRDPLAALKDGFGTCVSKHGLIAGLAREAGLPVYKTIGLYLMDAGLVNGIEPVLAANRLPFIPAIHCFLSYGKYRIDLTEGDCNGKNYQLEDFIFSRIVTPLFKEEEEQRLYDRWCESLLTEGGPLHTPGTNLGLIRETLRRCTEILKNNQTCRVKGKCRAGTPVKH
jgi:hypothetical protein